jgi:hypothetical protein
MCQMSRTMSISVKSICHVPYGTYIYGTLYIYMGLTMSISMKPFCDVCLYIRMYARIYMHACMCVCMYVCMYACMHACVCVCVCACVTNKQINSRILQQRRHHDIDPTIALCPPCQQSYTKPRGGHHMQRNASLPPLFLFFSF